MMSFGTPSISLLDDVLTRRAGIFYRRSVCIAEVQRVVAVVRDAVTHEELVVLFFHKPGKPMWISEFDLGFAEVIRRLPSVLPGFVSPSDLVAIRPFEGAQRLLWERPKPAPACRD